MKYSPTPRHAVNAALTAWHLHEWVWAHHLKGDFAKSSLLTGAPIRKIEAFTNWAVGECPHLATMQAIANGSKHLSLDGPIDTTSVHGGAFSQEFSRAFDISRLEIRFSNGQTRYFDVILDETVEWWRGVLEKLK